MVKCWFDNVDCMFEERPQESGWCLACSTVNKEADRVFAIAKEQLNMLKDIMAFVGQAASQDVASPKDVKVCDKCGEDNRIIAVYCNKCGKELVPPYYEYNITNTK